MEKDLVRDYTDEDVKLRITLPIPPSVNHMYRNTRTGGKQLNFRANNYVRDSRAQLNDQLYNAGWVKPPKNVWLYADMVFYFPDRRIRDSHNCLKLLMDVMEGKVFINDYTIMPRIQGVEYDKENPRIEISFKKQGYERFVMC